MNGETVFGNGKNVQMHGPPVDSLCGHGNNSWVVMSSYGLGIAIQIDHGLSDLDSMSKPAKEVPI